MSAVIRPWIEKSTCITEPLRARLLSALDSIPNPKTCLHGDLHIGNIITDGERNLWIDVGDFSYGCPEWDICMIFFAANYLSDQRTENIFHIKSEVLKKHWEIFSEAYYSSTVPSVLEKKQKALYRYAALKQLFYIGKKYNGAGAPPDAIIAMTKRMLG